MGRGGITPEESGLLDLLGLRVRRARAALGLSRRALEARAGVSERYLAQLEAGRGNISILLLSRIAVALGADLADLLAPPVDLARRGRIALLGLDPAARHECAIALGERLGVPVFHLDVAATALNGGAAAVQRADAEAEIVAFAGLIETHARCVFSIGEALLVEPRAWRLFRARCFTLWLKAGLSPRLSVEEASANDVLRSFETLADVQTRAASLEPRPAGGEPPDPEPGALPDASLDSGQRQVPASPAASSRETDEGPGGPTLPASNPTPSPREPGRDPDLLVLGRFVDALSSRADLVIELPGRDLAAWVESILPLVADTQAVAAAAADGLQRPDSAPTPPG